MRFLLYLLLFIVVFQMISRYLFPFIVKRYIQKIAKQQGQNYQAPRPEGEVTVNYKSSVGNQSKFKPDEIEDVDYEEIKEK